MPLGRFHSSFNNDSMRHCVNKTRASAQFRGRCHWLQVFKCIVIHHIILTGWQSTGAIVLEPVPATVRERVGLLAVTITVNDT